MIGMRPILCREITWAGENSHVPQLKNFGMDGAQDIEMRPGLTVRVANGQEALIQPIQAPPRYDKPDVDDSNVVSNERRAVALTYLPMQKLPNIWPNRSSLVNSPVISPSACCARRKSSANNSRARRLVSA